MSDLVPETPLEVIIEKLTELDNKMTNHQNNCFKCSPGAPCDVWIKMIQDFNFYHLAMVRDIRELEYEVVLRPPPGYDV